MECQLVCRPKNCPRGWEVTDDIDCFNCECFEQIDGIHHINGEGFFTCSLEQKNIEEKENEF